MLYRIAAMIVATVKDWLKHRATSKSAALAFYALFSLAPLFILVVSISGFFVGTEAAESAIFSQMRTVLGDAFSDEIRRLLLRAIESGYRGRANVIASFLLLFASTSALAELKVSLDAIWEEPASTNRGFLPWLRRNLLAFALILALAFLLLCSLLVSTGLQSIGRLWIDLWPSAPMLLRPLSSVLSFLAIAILFAIIYKTLPQRRLDGREVLVGAVTSALLFHIGRVIISAYLNRAWLTTVYEAAGSIVVLTAWVYYSALVFLLGAEFTRNYAHAFGSRAPRKRSGRLNSPPKWNLLIRDITGETMAGFDANKDIRIEVKKVSQRFHLQTNGLVRFERRELELTQVTESQVKHAGGLLNMTGAYSVTQKAIGPGELHGAEVGEFKVVVRLVDSPEKPALLRLIAPEPRANPQEPPLVALHTMELARAEIHLQEDEPEKALDVLQQSIVDFPGDPAGRDNPGFRGIRYNIENHLTYLRLAQLVGGDDGLELYREAMARSAQFERNELGGPAGALLGLDWKMLRTMAEEIVTRNLAEPAIAQNIAPNVALIRSPLWSLGEDGNAVKDIAVLPSGFTSTYFDGDARNELKSGWPAKLAADVLSANKDPVALAWSIRDIAALWKTSTSKPAQTGIAFKPAHRLLSLVLADIGRRAAARTSPDEIRAALGLLQSEAYSSAAQRKRDAFERDVESKWYESAILPEN